MRRLTLYSVVAAMMITASTGAFAGSVVMTFNCTTTPGAVANGSGCTNSLAPTAPLTSWTQGGFTLTPSTFLWNPNQGETGLGTGVTGAAGKGYFSLSGGAGTPGAGQIGKLTLTDGGGLFNFDSFDVKASAAGTYMIQYYDANGNLISADTQNGSISGANKYVTIDGKSVEAAKVVITLNDTGNDWVDYLDMNTPEPSSLLLLGTGMLGLAFLLRRKLMA